VKTDTPELVGSGGTNLRAAWCRMYCTGGKRGSLDLKRAMPGTQGALGAEAFFDAFAEFLDAIIAESEFDRFCFSYPARRAAGLRRAHKTAGASRSRWPAVVGR
jgi:hypothetical protein